MKLDAARDYAQHIPMRVIADMLGFPQEDGPRFAEFVENTLEGINLPPEDRIARMTALFDYLLAQINDHVDNPREEFSDLFDTHPPVDKRIEALIKFAGGHDPGPLALEPAESSAEPAPGGPWGEPGGPSGEPPPPPLPSAGPAAGQPFLPTRPPIELGGNPAPDPGAPDKPGPWGRHN